MKLLSWLLTLLDTPPIDVLSPPDPPEWDRELRRLQGIVEIHKCKAENVVFYNFAQQHKGVTK